MTSTSMTYMYVHKEDMAQNLLRENLDYKSDELSPYNYKVSWRPKKKLQSKLATKNKTTK